MVRIKVAHCSICKEILYQMTDTNKGYYPASQCLNRNCSKYGQPQPFKTGKRI